MTMLVPKQDVLSFQGPLRQCQLTNTSLQVPESFTEEQCLAVVFQLQSMELQHLYS